MSQPIRGHGGHLVFPMGPKNTNLVEDVEILLPVKFCWIPFSGFRGEVENVSANQRPGGPSCFSDRPEKHKLGRGGWDLASCKVWLNSVQRFQRRSRKCEKLTTDGRTDDGRTTDDGQRMITIVHLSLRLRCTNKRPSGPNIGHRSTISKCAMCFFSLLWDPLQAIIAPPWINPLADLAKKQQHLCGTICNYSTLTKFRDAPPSSSREKAE